MISSVRISWTFQIVVARGTGAAILNQEGTREPQGSRVKPRLSKAVSHAQGSSAKAASSESCEIATGPRNRQYSKDKHEMRAENCFHFWEEQNMKHPVDVLVMTMTNTASQLQNEFFRNKCSCEIYVLWLFRSFTRTGLCSVSDCQHIRLVHTTTVTGTTRKTVVVDKKPFTDGMLRGTFVSGLQGANGRRN